MNISYEQIKALPKTDLHCHLDGSIRLETILDLAKKQNVTLPTQNKEELFHLVYAGPECSSLVDYLKAFDITLSVLQTKESLTRVAYELGEDCAEENVRYLEVRYAPLLHTREGLSLKDVVDAVLLGLSQAEKSFGIQSRLILCGIRSFPSEQSLEMAKLCVAYKNKGVVAFDLAGAEMGHPPKDHMPALELIQHHYLSCTIHAGEADGPKSVLEALHPGGAHRIGHGARIVEDTALLHYVRDHQIPLEVCPSSNVQTKAVQSFEKHPLLLYHNMGCKVTINTDNRLVTNTTVTDELWQCQQQFGFDFDDIKRLILNGFESAFLPYPEKQALLEKVKKELQQFA